MLISEFLNLKCRSEDFDLEVKHYEIRLKTLTILAQYFMLYLQWHDFYNTGLHDSALYLPMLVLDITFVLYRRY